MNNGKPSVFLHSEFGHIHHPYYFSIRLLSALSIEIPILHLPLAHGVILALYIHLILNPVEMRVALFLVIFLKED